MRSLGSKKPLPPSVENLTDWVSLKKGTAADLILWEVEETLRDQSSVLVKAAGGTFYRGRVLDALSNVSNDSVVSEFDPNLKNILDDCSAAKKIFRSFWWSLPSPSGLSLANRYFSDEGEMMEGLAQSLKSIFRGMRDAGVFGQVLFTDVCPNEVELEFFSGKKFLWHVPDLFLENVLEVQRDLVLSSHAVMRLEELLDSYAIRNLLLVDPTENSLREVCRHFDPEYVSVCGVAPESGREEYWRALSEMEISVREL